METATHRLTDIEKALKRRLDESTRLFREHQNSDFDDDQRLFLILGDIEAEMTAKSAVRKKRRKW